MNPRHLTDLDEAVDLILAHTYGPLRIGAPADVTVLELAEGDFDFVDNYRGVRKGTQKLMTRAVVMGGAQVV